MVAVIPGGFPTRVPQKNLLHAKSLLPLTPWVIVISAVAATPSFDIPTLALWIGIHTVTLFGAGFVGLGCSEFLRRRGKTELTFWWVVGTGALVGGLKALGTVAIEEILGLADAPASAIVARALGGVIVGVWLVTLFAYGKTALESVQQAREALIRQNVAQRLAGEAAVARPEVAESLTAIRGLRRDLTGDPERVSPDHIRAVVDSTIRPLSRALWSVENKRYPALKLFSLYRIALNSLSLRAWLIALIWSATTFTALAVPLGLTAAATYAALVGVVAFGVFSAVRLGWTQSVTVSFLVVSLASVGSVFVGYLLTGLVLSTEPQLIDLLTVVTGAVWMFFVVFGSSVFSGVVELRDIIRQDLERQDTKELIRERSADDTSAFSTRLLATQLHGSVQSGLLGIASALDRGDISPSDVDKRLAAIAHELELLGSADISQDGDAAISVTVLDDLVSNWLGMLDIVVDKASTATIVQLLRRSPESAEILREALANASRHGHATRVTIGAVADPLGDVTLTITDNGYGPRSGPPGLGSTLLDTWTAHRWALTAHPDGGSELTATITPTGVSVQDADVA